MMSNCVPQRSLYCMRRQETATRKLFLAGSTRATKRPGYSARGVVELGCKVFCVNSYRGLIQEGLPIVITCMEALRDYQLKHLTSDYAINSL